MTQESVNWFSVSTLPLNIPTALNFVTCFFNYVKSIYFIKKENNVDLIRCKTVFIKENPINRLFKPIVVLTCGIYLMSVTPSLM